MTSSVMWFRRDLRLADHPALLAAAADDARVLPLFVLDPALIGPAGPARRAWLAGSLQALDESLDGRLVIRSGSPADVVPRVAAQCGAGVVHVTADAGPYGRSRDQAVARALERDGRRLSASGTPYAVGPGTLLTGAGTPFQVFTPFSRAWRNHGWPAPAPQADVTWAAGTESDASPTDISVPGQPAAHSATPGEAAARARWAGFLAGDLAGYASGRDRPDLNSTSGLSAYLKFGEIHPRTLLHDLAGNTAGSTAGAPADPDDVRTFTSELCWREFYADVLWHRPASARTYLREAFGSMRYDPPDERFEAWRAGRTGFPMVDAGMRQLATEGWMHNRVRMITASFLVKDLHVEWQHGARWFMHQLRDGDLASNQHGWQWVAGSGTDAAPYFRIFNPVTQGHSYDPDGDFVRRYVPELGHLGGAAVHEPWKHPQGYAHGYPERIVDHAVERVEALTRLGEIKK